MLALLQEVEQENRRQKHSPSLSRPGFKSSAPDKFRNSMPEKVGKSSAGKTNSEKPVSDEKLRALMVFRKKNGLCYKCGEKWGHGHKCPSHVSLHVIEELVYAIEHGSSSESDQSEEEELDTIMAVSVSTNPQAPKRRTMKIHGVIDNQEVLILVDSGSVATFVSEQLVTQLQLPMKQCTSAQYLAADGSPMTCTHIVPGLHWSSQGHTFTLDAGILPLKCYDMIVGEDWLEDCSPMWVHWKKKIMKFTYQKKRITLQGVRSDVVRCTPIGAHKLRGLIRRKALTHCIQMLPVSPIHTWDRSDAVI